MVCSLKDQAQMAGSSAKQQTAPVRRPALDPAPPATGSPTTIYPTAAPARSPCLRQRSPDHRWSEPPPSQTAPPHRDPPKTESTCASASAGREVPSLPHHNNVRAIIAELSPQFRLHVDIKIQHCRCHGRRHHHCNQRCSRPSAPQHRRPHQHAHKHRRMRRLARLSATLWARLRQISVHNSPRSAYTGSRPTAFRIAAALPANVTIIAIARITGKITGAIVICELKIDRPICRANSPPATKPTKPPISASKYSSAKNTDATASFPAPSAFINPTSDRRSKMAVAIAADTANPDANSAANVIRNMSPSMRVSTAPSFCETCRICSACECGITPPATETQWTADTARNNTTGHKPPLTCFFEDPAAQDCIFRLGQRTYIHPPYRSRPAQNFLRHRNRRHNFIVFHAAARKNSAHS